MDIVVIVSEHASELTEFWKFRFRVFGVERIAEFSRGFADSFQAPFDGILRLAVGGELWRGDTLYVGADPRDVIENIAQALFGVARRHGFPLEEHFERREI